MKNMAVHHVSENQQLMYFSMKIRAHPGKYHKKIAMVNTILGKRHFRVKNSPW